MATCNVTKGNLGLSQCNKLPQMIVGMITTPADFSIPAATYAVEADLLTYLNAALLDPAADRIYLWPNFRTFENISTEAVYEDTPMAYLPVRDGDYRFKFGIKENLCLHKKMYTHRASNGRVILIDNENQLIGTELSDGSFAGLTMQMLHTEKFMFNDGSVSTKSPIVIALQNNKELDKDGSILQADFVGELYRIVDVTLTIVGTPTTSSIVVDVAAECDGTAITGLVVADFNLTDDDDGANHAISSATESSTVPGRYTLAGTAFEDSVLNLDAPDVLSIQAYESTGGVAVTIP